MLNLTYLKNVNAKQCKKYECIYMKRNSSYKSQWAQNIDQLPYNLK